MKIFLLLITIIIGLVGLLLLISTLMASRKIYLGEVSSRVSGLSNAFLTGLSTSMLFLTLILVGSILDKNYKWSIASILVSLTISILLGLIIFISAFIGFIIVDKYREILGRIINKKINKHTMK